jgi:signal transduction histidine kinase/ActR/RegA family two-component response regulator
MAAALIVPAALFAYASFVNNRTIYSAADERIARSLDVMQEQTLRVFRSAELAFAYVDDMVRGLSDDDIRAHEESLHARLAAIDKTLSQADSITIYDRNGHPLVSSRAYPVSRTLNESGRDFFRHQADRDAGLFFGDIIVPSAPGAPYFSLSRRRPSPDGAFAGVIVAAIIPKDFEDFYARIGQFDGSYYALLRDDGLMLARYPMPPDRPLRLLQPAPALMAMAARSGNGVYTVRSQIDGIERRIGYRRMEEFPVYLLAGIQTDALLAEWLRAMASHLIFGIPATLLLFGAIGVVLRRTEGLYAEADRRAAAEEALRQSQKMEAVGQLTGGIAHDFNNLLTVIIGNLEIAQRNLNAWHEGAEDRLKRTVNNAMRGAYRAADLTKRLLAFSRRQPLDPKPIDVNKLIVGLTEFLRRSVGERVAIETVSAAALWKVEADPSELETAIVNLAVNARDAMPDGGRLTIETSNAFLDEEYCRRHLDLRPGQHVLISVTDTGTGMSPEVAERVFEPFFTTKTAGQGTGLGLSQVYGFVKQSGGHVKVHTEPGKGTCVRIYLPRLMRDAPVEDESEAEFKVGRSGATILVIEDDDDVRSYVVEILRELKYGVFDAPDAAKAFAMIEQKKPRIDLLLTDVVLPGLNGRQTAERMKADQPDLKVLFMTGYSRNAIVHEGRLDPGVELIQKPLTQTALAARIAGMLEAREAEPVA